MAWSVSSPGGDGTLVAGGNGRGDNLDQLISPSSIFVDDSLVEFGNPIVQIFACDRYNHRIMKIRVEGLSSTESVLAAGGCLQSPSYVQPCAQGGLHYPPDPGPHRIDHINPSNHNPPEYHFWGPSGV